MKKFLISLCAIVFFFGTVTKAGALLLTATFDSFSEGQTFSSLTDGGITFSNLDAYGIMGNFTIESSVSSTMGASFSPPNYLTTMGYVPGPGTGFGRFGSADLTVGMNASDVSLDIFHLPTSSSNILTLQALLNGTVVSSDFISMNILGTGVLNQNLSISGVTFDALQLVASGTQYEGAVFIGIDNVTVTSVPIPESATLLLLSSCLFGLGAFRKKFKK